MFDAKSDPYFSMCSRDELLDEITAWQTKHEKQIEEVAERNFEKLNSEREARLSARESDIRQREDEAELALNMNMIKFIDLIEDYSNKLYGNSDSYWNMYNREFAQNSLVGRFFSDFRKGEMIEKLRKFDTHIQTLLSSCNNYAVRVLGKEAIEYPGRLTDFVKHKEEEEKKNNE